MATYDEAAREAMATAPDGGLFYTPLEIMHPTLDDPVRIVLAQENMTFHVDGQPQEFLACAYNLRLPSHGLAPDPHAVITLDAAPGDLIQAAFTLAWSCDPAQVVVREYLPSDLLAPRAELNMYMTDISANMSTMSAKLRILNAANVAFPANIIDGENFASLVA